MRAHTVVFTVRLTAPQYEWLVGEASRLGISTADLIRRAVDEARRPVAMSGRGYASAPSVVTAGDA